MSAQRIEKLVKENNALDRGERMPALELPAHLIQCEGCLLILLKEALAAAGYVCEGCGDMMCVVCGCTDSVACAEGCTWSSPGHCSTHDEEEA